MVLETYESVRSGAGGRASRGEGAEVGCVTARPERLT